MSPDVRCAAEGLLGVRCCRFLFTSLFSNVWLALGFWPPLVPLVSAVRFGAWGGPFGLGAFLGLVARVWGLLFELFGPWSPIRSGHNPSYLWCLGWPPSMSPESCGGFGEALPFCGRRGSRRVRWPLGSWPLKEEQQCCFPRRRWASHFSFSLALVWPVVRLSGP